MTDDFTREQSAQAIRLFTAYHEALDEKEIEGRFMPYRWWTSPERGSFVWMIYSQMLGEYATELANIVNDLTHNVHRLRAWARVIETLDDEERLAATHEFIDTLGTVSLGLPYAIKSRFAFAAGTLAHQANRTRDGNDWKDEFPDVRALYLHLVDPICSGWRKYGAFKRRVEPIAGTAFKDATEDFRNAYQHRFSARFVVGITNAVTRIVGEDGKVAYGIGGTEPLGLDRVADLLAIERDHCYRAFDAFRELVEEQIPAIAAFDAASLEA